MNFINSYNFFSFSFLILKRFIDIHQAKRLFYPNIYKYIKRLLKFHPCILKKSEMPS